MEQLNELAAALVKAQAMIQPALKDKTNPAFRSRYADLTAIWDACREALTSNGIAVIQMPHDATEPGRVALMTMLIHTSGQQISTTVSAPLVKQDAQGVGSALTYLRRYSLAAMVGVVTDDDDDGNAASKTPQQAAYQKPEPRQQAAPAGRTNGDSAPAPTLNDAMRKTYERASAHAGRVIENWQQLMVWVNRPVTTPQPTTIDGWRALYRLCDDRATELAAEQEGIPA